MVFDKIENAHLYYGLGERFRRALEWLALADGEQMVSGQRVDIDGDKIYATMFDIDTLPPAACRLESHRNYADIQYLVSGRERVGYAIEGSMAAVTNYEPDIQLFTGDWDTLLLCPGCFYIVWPQDQHAPRMADGAVARVRRIVVKVKL